MYSVSTVIAIAVYETITKFISKSIEICCNCEALGVIDEVFLLDHDKNNSNVLLCLFFDPFDYEEMKRHNMNTLCEISPKMKTKLVKKFGRHYH